MSTALEILAPALDPWIAGAIAVIGAASIPFVWARSRTWRRVCLVAVVVTSSASALAPHGLRAGPNEVIVDVDLDDVGGCQRPHHALERGRPTRVRLRSSRLRVVSIGGATRVLLPNQPRDLGVVAPALVDKPCDSPCPSSTTCFAGRCRHVVHDLLRPFDPPTDAAVLHVYPPWTDGPPTPSWRDGQRWWRSEPCTACHLATPQPELTRLFDREVPPPDALLARFDVETRTLGTCHLAKFYGALSEYRAKSVVTYLGLRAAPRVASGVSVPRPTAEELEELGEDAP